MARSSQVSQSSYELEVIPGLEAIAVSELRRVAGGNVELERGYREGLLPFVADCKPAALLKLRTVLAVYARRRFAIPRPKALLGQQHMDALLGMIQAVRRRYPADTWTTLRVSAAGQDSSVLRRLRDELALRTGLEDVDDEGDLLLRLRRPLDGSDGWEVLLRLSPRPLATRTWRVCNYAGALNASVAHAMALLTQPGADDAVLNLCCGSGTLLIERLAAAPARIAIGCDVDADALLCAAENAAAAGARALRIESWDAGALPVPDAWVDALLADLPFGQLVGSHENNLELYPQVLREATRVAIGGAVFVAITHEIRLWERLVADAAADWSLDAVLPIKLPFGGGYLRPRIFVLRRR